MIEAPNHELQQTALRVTLAASGLRLSPTTQPVRRAPQSLSLGALAPKMKALFLLLSFAPIAWAGSEADGILTQYYRAVAAEIARDPEALGMDGVLKKYEELGTKFLLANKQELHKKAVADYIKHICRKASMPWND